MYRWLIFSLLILNALHGTGLKNTTCKQCHTLIYAEYQASMHSHASIFKDPVHKAVWDKHPAKKKNRYKCAVCHTPADKAVVAGKPLSPNPVQLTQPISCQTCHTIERIEKHPKFNKNVYTKKKKYFFSADPARKGQKIVFKKKSYMMGLFKKDEGSPFHDIDYSNEIYYNGQMCMGCHSHKQNGKGFTVCDLEVKQGDSKETCISCHMPRKKGTLANQKQSSTHAFHGVTIHEKNRDLSKYIELSLERNNSKGFDILISNKATHTLFPQPLRLAQLRVSIESGAHSTSLPPVSFMRIIGTQGKPSMPWLATEVLKDTTIKALQKRKIHFDTSLHQGDTVVVEFGYYLVNPKAAKKLGITDKKMTNFIVLTQKRFPL